MHFKPPLTLFDDIRRLTVSEANAEARALLEEAYADVWVTGEVSNYKGHTSGHLYFTLKDSESQLRSVCFRSDARRLGFELEDGMQVHARGRLTIYEAYGQYQLVVNALERSGVGELERAFRELKERLAKEGLFDPAHKMRLPRYPAKVAVVTSPTGAAIHDILSTLERRWPALCVVLCPVSVQGERAPEEIVAMLGRLPEIDGLDLVILGRGGGSLEDLWAFNDERVARAIYTCPIPLVSAVGHETDFTIADFVADARAATPTMAAEMAVPHIDEVSADLDQKMRRFNLHMASMLRFYDGRVRELLRSYALGKIKARIEHAMQTHDLRIENLLRRMAEGIRARQAKLLELTARIAGLDARSILQRGYALCSDYETGTVVRTADGAVAAVNLRVTFHDGDVLSVVKEKIDEQHRI
jgi:exodeoxyribonuclease VII large subunit